MIAGMREYNETNMGRLPALLSCFCLAISVETRAESNPVPRLHVGVGGYLLTNFDSGVMLEGTSSGAGIILNPREALDLEFENTVFRFDSLYRFTPNHSIAFSWYRITSSGEKTLKDEIEWGDEVIPVGASVTTTLKYDIYKLGYRWSFHHSDKVELAVGAGLHTTQLTLNLDARTTIGDLDTQDVNTTVPLPVLMFSLGYQINDHWRWSLDNEWFSLDFGDLEGLYIDSTLRLEHRIWKTVHLGAGLGSNVLGLAKKIGDAQFTYTNRIAGGLFYLATDF